MDLLGCQVKCWDIVGYLLGIVVRVGMGIATIYYNTPWFIMVYP